MSEARQRAREIVTKAWDRAPHLQLEEVLVDLITEALEAREPRLSVNIDTIIAQAQNLPPGCKANEGEQVTVYRTPLKIGLERALNQGVPEFVIEALREIEAKKSQTLLHRCCVDNACEKASSDDGRIEANCTHQLGVNRGFSECASIAADCLEKLGVK